MNYVSLVVAGELLHLLPQRALFWPRRDTLLLADPHFGKAASFRAGGIPVPGGTTGANLARLDAALAATGATRLVCLGDLLHARAGRVELTVDEVSTWRQRYPDLELLLVRGNHDRHAGDPPASWGIRCVDGPFADPPFCLRHLAEPDPTGYTLAGHLHPALQVGRGAMAETVACFYFGKEVGILPAFGEFTGTGLVRPEPGDRVFLLAEEEVIPVTVP